MTDVLARQRELLADFLQCVVFVHADPEVRAQMRSSRGVTELRVRFLSPNQADTGSPMSREDVAAVGFAISKFKQIGVWNRLPIPPQRQSP
jgi:hypothetical protein